MRYMLRLAIVCCLVVFLSSSALALKYEIDGDISDWGVDPFNQWTPSASTADFAEHNDVNAYGAVGYNEGSDYEALYFDDDEHYFYFAAVSSYNMSIAGSAGDLMIDVDGDMQVSEHGVVTGSDYGLLVADYSWQGRLVTGTERSTTYYEFPDGWQGGPYRMIYWQYVGDCITEIALDATLEGSPSYLLEAAIPRDLLGPLGPGDTIGIHLTSWSGRDSINLFGTVDTYPNPEPSTILLLGGGLAGVVAYYTTKRR